MKKLTARQYDTLCLLARVGSDSRTYAACKRVIVDGLTQAAAVRETGIAKGTMSLGIKKIQTAYTLAKEVTSA